ncbi:unnamed protein product [Coccothraustes coccothraustes]
MAGERTRRFTRSLLRPGQAAELRHSAAAAAASGRLQLRAARRPPFALAGVLSVRPRLAVAVKGEPGAPGRSGTGAVRGVTVAGGSVRAARRRRRCRGACALPLISTGTPRQEPRTPRKRRARNCSLRSLLKCTA